MNPNHPSHKIKAPRAAIGILDPGIAYTVPSAPYLPFLAPRILTAAPDTPTGGFATLIGLIGGVIVYFSVVILDTKLKIDDPVGAISAHGTVGIWGIMATPLSGAGAFGTQLIGVIVIFAWVFVTSFIVLKVIDSIVGIRATDNDEEIGLDKSEIGVEAYPDFK